MIIPSEAILNGNNQTYILKHIHKLFRAPLQCTNIKSFKCKKFKLRGLYRDLYESNMWKI